MGLALLWSKIKKGKIALSFASPEKENYYFIYYDVIVKQIFYKRSSNHYSRAGLSSLMWLPIQQSSRDAWRGRDKEDATCS
jgi:hypothetical protein